MTHIRENVVVTPGILNNMPKIHIFSIHLS